jgi:CRP-like cAMP-binding protein
MISLDGHRVLSEMGLDRLRSASIFGALSEEALNFLFTQGRVFSVVDGENLFCSGNCGDSFFVVLEGALELVAKRDGEAVLLKVAGFGEQLGYVTMVGLFDRLGDGRGRGSTVVLEVTSDLYFQFHLDFPLDFGILMLNLSRDMARTLHKIATERTQASIDQALA